MTTTETKREKIRRVARWLDNLATYDAKIAGKSKFTVADRDNFWFAAEVLSEFSADRPHERHATNKSDNAIALEQSLRGENEPKASNE
jgi:hypothetical protein